MYASTALLSSDRPKCSLTALLARRSSPSVAGSKVADDGVSGVRNEAAGCGGETSGQRAQPSRTRVVGFGEQSDRTPTLAVNWSAAGKKDEVRAFGRSSAASTHAGRAGLDSECCRGSSPAARMAAHATAQLLNGLVAALAAPLADDQLHALALVVGPAMLLEALDLLDKDQGTGLQTRYCPPPRARVRARARAERGRSHPRLTMITVARIMPPNGRPLYQVASSSGGQPYTVFPEVPAGTGYCPCPAYSFGVLAHGNQVTVREP